MKKFRPFLKSGHSRPNKQKLGLLPNHWKIILVVIVILIAYGLVFFSTARAEGLNVACYKDYRPYSYVNAEGEVVGVLVDFWKIWAQKNDVALTFIPGHLSESLSRVAEGEADFMIGLFQSEARAGFLEFSDPILDVQTNLYIRQDMALKDLKELGDTVVGVIDQDYVVSFLAQNHPYVKIKTFPGSEAVVKNALAGKLSAYALDFPNAIFLLAEHDAMTQFKIFQTLYTGKLRAGVAKGNNTLTIRLNKGIKAVTQAEVTELSHKWGIIPEPLMLRYRGWIIAAIVLLLGGCIGFGVYIYRLRSRLRQVKSENRPFDRDEWLALIGEGETDEVEFKSSLRWNIRTEAPDQAIEQAIIKAISSFMNSRGGSLFIGVNDAGELVGLDKDYTTFQKARDRDGFMLKLASLINSHMGRSCHKFISTDIQNINGLDLCRVLVRPGDSPVFVKAKGKEHFFIRAGAASASLTMSETHEYIRSRW